MEFNYTYKVKASTSELWSFITDIPTVGLCIPGATDVSENEDGTYSGTVKVRVGPVALGLAGKLSVDSRDDNNLTITMTGEGADRKVPGNVRVKISMSVQSPGDGSSELVVNSEANIMGKLGEFGQGIIKRKADGIMKDFGQNLAKRVEA
ncbi:MAG: SRPBCC family protein [Dehalococcoidia bacterium]|jgi:carbon monoxide dehydrogenase subunit G|nr:SRPBCC family protein [Dehalococcoidia bacterium]|tara:strand:+ start:117 stop:566 length:450 start_codon:yes stop_codon:yes gene_type:complete